MENKVNTVSNRHPTAHFEKSHNSEIIYIVFLGNRRAYAYAACEVFSLFFCFTFCLGFDRVIMFHIN